MAVKKTIFIPVANILGFALLIFPQATAKVSDWINYERFPDAVAQFLPANPELPEIYYDAKQFIETQGYPFEEHKAITSDGYILTLHRIPYGIKTNIEANETSSRPVAYIQHGVLSSTDDWVINGAEQSLAFLLADAGFDVWLGNVRGNVYSQEHVHLNVTDHDFWQFTFHEMALLDLPAMLDYIAKITGQEKMHYIGYSQGTLMGFIQFSEYPEYAKKRVKQFHAMAPIAYLKHVQTPLKLLCWFSPVVQTFLNLIGFNQFLPETRFVKWWSSSVCGSAALEPTCNYITFLVNGIAKDNINATRLPIYAAHNPAGTSSKDMIHFAQNIAAKQLQLFDYGYLRNLLLYGSLYPPKYHPSSLAVPTALYWGSKDDLATPVDVAELQAEIQNATFSSYKVEGAVHLDFMWGYNAQREVYPRIIQFLKNGIPPYFQQI